MYIVIHTSIYRLFSLSLSLYILNMVSEPFLWLSGSCGLQLSDIIVLLIQLQKQRYRATEQPILSKTMNTLSILRSTATSLASISRKEISSYSPSPLLTNLLISLPRLTRLVVFEILYPNSSWLPPCHLEFGGGC